MFNKDLKPTRKKEGKAAELVFEIRKVIVALAYNKHKLTKQYVSILGEQVCHHIENNNSKCNLKNIVESLNPPSHNSIQYWLTTIIIKEDKNKDFTKKKSMTTIMMVIVSSLKTRIITGKHVYRPPTYCCCLIILRLMMLNVFSWCTLTVAINSNDGGSFENTTMKTILKFATATATTFNTTNAFDREITFPTAFPYTQPLKPLFLHQVEGVASEIKEIEKQYNKNTSTSLQLWQQELKENLKPKSNNTITPLPDISNLTNASNSSMENNEFFHDTETVKGSLSTSTTMAFNHSDVNSFSFHEECLANINTLPHICTIVLYSVVCVVGLFGNTLVIWVVLRFSKMQTVTNIYILNLAIADECFLIGIPFLLYTMRICSWKFGDYMCKAYMVSTSITQFTSSIFLLIMAADRYIAVCHPIESPKYRTLRIAKLVSLLAWFTSAILMLPVILFASTVRQEDGINFSCNIDWPEMYKKHSGTTFILYTFLLGFATPLCFILIFYYLVIRKLHTVQQKHKSKEKKRSHRKVTRLVLTVITVYILCWLPHWISQVSLISAFVGQRQELSRFEISLYLLFGCLAYSNSAMNPILYAFLSDNFRKSFSKAFSCMHHHEIEAQLINEHSIVTHKRSASNAAVAGVRKNSKYLSASRATNANKQNNCSSFLAATTVHGCNSAVSAAGGASSSATSTSTATTNTDKSSTNNTKKSAECLNGDAVLICPSSKQCSKDDERIHMVVSHDERSLGFKTSLCHKECEKQTDV